MRQDHRFRKQKGMSDDQKRILSMALIPLIVIVLIIVIVIADRAKEKAALQEQAETEIAGQLETSENPEVSGADEGEADSGDLEAEGEGDGQDEATADGQEDAQNEENAEEDGDAFASEHFQKDSVPEILDLMKRYFEARVQADAETMNALYGIEGVSAEALEAQKTKMRSNAKYVSDFQNITTYVMNGTTGDSWLVYTLADIKFYTAKTAAPMIMWCYVQKNAEGTYQIVDNSKLSSNVQLFIDAANHSQEVRSLAADVNGRLKKALSEDEDLNDIYGVIRDGSPVWESEETEASVVVLDGAADAESSVDVEGSADAEGNADMESSADAESNVDVENGADSERSENGGSSASGENAGV